jgi:hypothetical protein
MYGKCPCPACASANVDAVIQARVIAAARHAYEKEKTKGDTERRITDTDIKEPVPGVPCTATLSSFSDPALHVGDQGARNDRTDAGNRGEQILLNSASSASSAFLTRAILLIKRLPDALVGNAAAALAFGGDHLDDLAAAGDKAGIGTPSLSSASTRNSGSVKSDGVVLTTSLAAPRACATSASDAIADCRYFRAASSAISPPERGR